jgi:hypothetical protein
MRAAAISLLALAGLLSGTIPSSKASDCLAPRPIEPIGQITHRLVELPSSRTENGLTRLREVRIEPRPTPFHTFDMPSFHQILVNHADFLGPAAGKPTQGFLLNGEPLPASPMWTIQVPNHAWGTPSLIACLQRTISAVHDEFPNTPALHIGDLSRRRGGYLGGHASHQSGFDADLGFYYRGESAWYVKATEKNLDQDRTWALVRALVTDCDVQYIFLDYFVMAVLRQHASQLGEDPAWLDELFAKGPYRRGIIRHAHGHRTHMHVRIYDNQASALGEQVERVQLWARARNLPSTPLP